MKISIVHFHPLEMYPPVMNFINFLEDYPAKISKINVCTTSNLLTHHTFASKGNFIKIGRSRHPGSSNSIIIRFLWLLKFNIITLIRLIHANPDLIIYYETFSALPVYIYLRYFRFRLKPRLYIHYHEYTTPEEYQKMPSWVRFNYHVEKKVLWKLAEKISHTNSDRLDIFGQVQKIDNHKLLVLPNFPPKKWALFQNDKKTDFPIKIIYIGSLSFEDTYIKEFTDWVISNSNDVHFDIFSYNHKPGIKDFFTENNFSNITFHPEGIHYYDIPSLLKQYQIGVIAYKANTENVKFCASNKLFEYYACGLDVWVSEEMVTSRPYVTNGVYPKITMVDFKNLKQLKLSEAISHKGLIYKSSDYFCENIYSSLTNVIVNGKR